MRKSALLLLALALAVMAFALRTRFQGTGLIEKHHGVSWVGGPRPIEAEHIGPLVANGVDWIVQTPFGWQRQHDRPALNLNTQGRVLWGESDQGLRVTTELARKRGIKTLLKPHIWLLNRRSGKWRSDIAMTSEDDWKAWFADYSAFIMHYSRLAQELEIEALCIGTELRATVVERESDWRSLIAAVRAVYSGRLTYAANWYREFEEVPFWDELDWIGIQAYFPLSQSVRPSLEELKSGWAPHLEAVQAVSERFGKPVLFTELGYRSVPNAAARPWEWPQDARDAEIDLDTQARAYEAFFQVFWHEPWFAGAYFWKWYPFTRRIVFGRNNDFTPQGKPAEEVMARWYSTSGGKAEETNRR